MNERRWVTGGPEGRMSFPECADFAETLPKAVLDED
jgi:hypothetical protein